MGFEKKGEGLGMSSKIVPITTHHSRHIERHKISLVFIGLILKSLKPLKNAKKNLQEFCIVIIKIQELVLILSRLEI